MMRDAWSMFHTTRRTNVDSYCEREFQAGYNRELKQRRRSRRGPRIVNLYLTGIF